MKSVLLIVLCLWGNLIVAQVEPLINNNWQTYQWPYNAYFPEAPGGVNGNLGNGCWITAMSRVVHYWQFPENGNGLLDFIDNEGYYWNCNYEELNLDYSLMPYELSEDATPEEYDQTAKLFYACGAFGASIMIGYGNSIDSLPRVLNNYFNYDTTATVVRRWHYTRDEWIAIFKYELDNGRPILIEGRTVDSPAPWEPGNWDGHFFACDGYNADNEFYINYSFGDIYGYYDIDSMDEFSAYHMALINLKPIDPSTGLINRKDEFVNIQILPNPVAELAAIKIRSLNNQLVLIELYDLHGHNKKTIYKGEIKIGDNSIDMKRMGFSSGLYFLKISTVGQSITKKIIFN